MTHTLQDSQVVGLGMNVLADLVREPLVLIGLMGYLFYTNWLLTLVCLVTLPFVGIVGKLFAKSARRNQSRLQNTIEQMSQHVVESINGIRTAHHLDQTGKLMNEFEDRSGQAYGFLVRLARIEELVGPMTKWTTAWIGVVLIGFGGYLVVQGDLSTGAFVSYLMTAAFMQQPLRMLNNASVRLNQMAAAGERIQNLLEQPPDAIEIEEQKVLRRGMRTQTPRLPTEILEFKDVDFEYPQRPGDPSSARAVGVQAIQLRIDPGKTVALVGPSGAGKSTISLLAMRFIDPQRGRIELGGRRVQDYPLNDYRAYFSYVSQDTFLFGRSLEDNLRLARPEASENEIWAALEKASCLDFVRELPQQLKTPMAEQAKSLSGGERQRLAIARAILKDAPILILDEATSQLDATNEDVIRKAVAELIKTKSSLIIAHRLSTIRHADEVLVLESGRIQERGSADALLKQQGTFYQLWKRQLGSELRA